ncbi:MAG: homoserine O-acetyltransferase [Acidobacteria bacterium]|nr:homoserine O-acetyltransferase [Acidobacteriota bacterium]MYF14643.1 homoserine O-acetyltransferase [Acidobacteriota bacterium]MYI96113.1 homoserine O-acetyltransferase [Acidobacteriota bacterium]
MPANAAPHRRLRLTPPGPFTLESGAVLPELEIACETWGEPDPGGGNTVLIAPALSADAHAAGRGGGAESAVDGFGAESGAGNGGLGWWDPMIGPGKAFDTDRFHVVCMSLLGGCGGTTGPSSLNPDTGRPYGADFPAITVGDIVRATRAGLHQLGVHRLRGISGGSLGGMQAFEWAAAFPDEVDAVVAVASTPGLSAQGIGWNWIARSAITGDPAWCGGRYAEEGTRPVHGLATARMVGHLTYLSAPGMETKFGRRLQDRRDFAGDLQAADFQVESYLVHQAAKFNRRFDANAYLFLSYALTRFDLAERYGGGDLEDAVERFRCRTLLLSFSSDWLYPSGDSRRLAAALEARRKSVVHHEIDTTYGHDSFLLEAGRMTPLVRGFLDHEEVDVP